MIDLYTKAVLTVIAVALCLIAVRGSAVFGPAIAQGSSCGESIMNPCYVEGTVEISDTVDVKGTVDIGNDVGVVGTVNVTGTVDIGNKVEIDTGVFGLPVHVR
ncbi:hypothetical protein [Hyphomicrobium sp. CS1GBMeth3]|uniref:hypothetical protein n=1 Tax=Hyphomicrobium sp. CS1GBMeth3 TaxID=1892845 RepID=UPI000931318D|nr:hypothetical protein [Hyphomicrobium sp. CS1GBMeth3]